jgi:hypothetical protein
VSLEEELRGIKLSLRSKGFVKTKQVITEKKSLMDESGLIQEGTDKQPVTASKSMLDESNLVQDDKPL